MAITIKQIAELAGVSAGTVDRALNNRGRVNPQVAERIKKIARELNYQPNTIAKSLSIKRRNLKIAVILNVSGNRFVDSILEGIYQGEKELSPAGFTIKIMPCKDFDAENQLELINVAVEEKFDGIVLIPINHEIIKDRINELSSLNYPVLFLTSIIEDTRFFAYVGCNYKYSGQISCGLVNQLTNGRANVGIFISNLQMWSNSLRLSSIESYMKTAYPGIHISKVLELSNDNIESYLQSSQLLSESPEIDAILYCSGAVDGGLKAILEHAQQRQLKIITFDYTDTIRQAMEDRYVIFTITQNPSQQGYQAMKIMSDYLITGQAPSSQFLYVNTEILILESIKDFENDCFNN